MLLGLFGDVTKDIVVIQSVWLATFREILVCYRVCSWRRFEGYFCVTGCVVDDVSKDITVTGCVVSGVSRDIAVLLGVYLATFGRIMVSSKRQRMTSRKK